MVSLTIAGPSSILPGLQCIGKNKNPSSFQTTRVKLFTYHASISRWKEDTEVVFQTPELHLVLITLLNLIHRFHS